MADAAGSSEKSAALSSYGDGFYATYVGFDEQGGVVRYVTELIDAGNA